MAFRNGQVLRLFVLAAAAWAVLCVFLFATGYFTWPNEFSHFFAWLLCGLAVIALATFGLRWALKGPAG